MRCFIVIILLSNAHNSMLVNDLPVFYSFRRCPYSMRARMVIDHSGIGVELREVLLSNKPNAMLAASAKGTVPVLVLPDGTVLDESLDIIKWALDQDTHNSNTLNLRVFVQDSEAGKSLIEINDGSLSGHLMAINTGRGFLRNLNNSIVLRGSCFYSS